MDHYVQHYNKTELNATHYKIYGPGNIKKWSDKSAGRNFIFCPNMYKGITHYGTLKGKEMMTTEFLKGLLAFEKNLPNFYPGK